ncbi:MAG: hypothetical protein WD971_03010, partial [Pirellulales bacterium]
IQTTGRVKSYESSSAIRSDPFFLAGTAIVLDLAGQYWQYLGIGRNRAVADRGKVGVRKSPAGLA